LDKLEFALASALESSRTAAALDARWGPLVTQLELLASIRVTGTPQELTDVFANLSESCAEAGVDPLFVH
jgi:hypothetical protein